MNTVVAPRAAAATPAPTRPVPLSYWAVVQRRFLRRRANVVALATLGLLYALAAGAEFFAPYPAGFRSAERLHSPPQLLRFSPRHGFYVRLLRQGIEPTTLARIYFEDPARIVPMRLLAVGAPYRVAGLLTCRRHFIGPAASAGTPAPPVYLFGGNKYGSDVLSRLIFGARVSLSVGMTSILLTLALGIGIGGLSGYVGGGVDTFIQRCIEVISVLPAIPIWMAVSAAIPDEWPPLRVYFAITLALALISWMPLARAVRGRILALREEEFVTAARMIGASHARVLFRHILPSLTSHILTVLIASVPEVILGETALSFLGLGLRPPTVSWGVMLQDVFSIQALQLYPWLLAPVLAIGVTVLAFNYVGEGLREAADPLGNH